MNEHQEVYTKLDAVEAIIGSIDGYGDTYIDRTRYKNICDFEPIILSWIEKLLYQENHKKRVEYSLKKQGEKAHHILEMIRDLVEREGEE